MTYLKTHDISCSGGLATEQSYLNLQKHLGKCSYFIVSVLQQFSTQGELFEANVCLHAVRFQHRDPDLVTIVHHGVDEPRNSSAAQAWAGLHIQRAL